MANRPPESEFAFCQFPKRGSKQIYFRRDLGGILSVALSPNGKFVAADTNGQIHVASCGWQATSDL